jgi:putative endonuclease
VDSLGKQGENFAVKFLKKIGYKILERNYRCALGEIDIIAKDKETLVFVEVKTRKTHKGAEPFESIGARKQAKIRDLAEYYLQEKSYSECEVRFDVLSIVLKDKEKQIEHIANAF